MKIILLYTLFKDFRYNVDPPVLFLSLIYASSVMWIAFEFTRWWSQVVIWFVCLINDSPLGDSNTTPCFDITCFEHYTPWEYTSIKKSIWVLVNWSGRLHIFRHCNLSILLCSCEFCFLSWWNKQDHIKWIALELMGEFSYSILNQIYHVEGI